MRLACDLPDIAGRSLSQWDGTELARQVQHEGIVAAISAATVQRILARWKLKPWRSHCWLHPRTPRDAAFIATTREIADLYLRPLRPTEMVRSLDEKTLLQPRPRRTPTRPARPGVPVQVEHEDARAGAVHRFAAFDTRTGTVAASPSGASDKSRTWRCWHTWTTPFPPASPPSISSPTTSACITARRSSGGWRPIRASCPTSPRCTARG